MYHLAQQMAFAEGLEGHQIQPVLDSFCNSPRLGQQQDLN